MGTDIDLTPQQRLERKLDRVLQILDGAGQDSPGLLHMVRTHDRALFGDEKHTGLVHDVRSLKRIKNWIMGSLSTAFGAGMAEGIRFVITHHF